MLGHICIINAPAVFRLIWNMAKGFIDVRTQGKIEVRACVPACAPLATRGRPSLPAFSDSRTFTMAHNPRARPNLPT